MVAFPLFLGIFVPMDSLFLISELTNQTKIKSWIWYQSDADIKGIHGY